MLEQLMSNLTVVSILAVLNSFLLVYYVVPKISWVIVERKLNDKPNERSSHSGATPTMAGVSFFITLIITMYFIQHFDTENIGLNLIAASTLIFIVGVKDDLVVSTPRAKLVMETLATLFLFFHSAMFETSLHGFLGIYELPSWLFYMLNVLLVLTIINAYNLIDGIDGLAAIVAIVIFSIFALIFKAIDLNFYFLISLSFIGMLVAYLYYNFSSTQKIFMGDTGSLLIGFSIGFLALKFLAIDIEQYTVFSFNPENELIVLSAILCIPIFDMFRVIGIRLLEGKSPLYPDRNHSHHVLIDSGLSHFQASMLLGFFNYMLVIAIVYWSSIFNSFHMVGVLILIFIMYLGFFYMLKRRITNKIAKIKVVVK